MTTGKRIWKAIGWFTPAFIGIICLLLSKCSSHFTEFVFSRGTSRFFNSTLGWLVSFIPFSLTELLVCVAVLSVLFLLVLICIPSKKDEKKTKEEERAENLHFLRIIGWVLSSFFLFYLLVHGLNFNRMTAYELCDLEKQPANSERLFELCTDLANRANLLREDLQEDENGVMKLSVPVRTTLKQIGDGYEPLKKTYPFLGGTVKRAKPVLLSHWWSYTGIEGLYFPLFTECNANIDIPDYAIPAAASHELAHLKGFAHEDECNFFGCLACFNSPHPDFQYSGTMLAFTYCSNQLYDDNHDLWKKAYNSLSPKVQKDYTSYNAYWDQFSGKIQDISLAINDKTIELQGDKDGSETYNQVVDLLMAAYEKRILF